MIHTPACAVLGIEHPVILAGMANGYSSAELVAAVSTAGGLGILGCLGRSADEAVSEIERIRALTDRPFGVNFVLPFLDDDTFRACLDLRVPIFSFYRGDPAEAIARAKAVGAVTIHQITTVDEAQLACAAGADVLMAQGYEAGGHTGPLPLLTLLPEVVDAAGSTPVLAAGGLVDGRGLAAMLCLGAAGIAMGSRFLATPECPTPDIHKRAILAARSGDTIATPMWDILWERAWPGLEVRALRNALTARWHGHEDELRQSIAEVRAAWEAGSEAEDTSRMCLVVGEGAGQIRDLRPAGQIVRDTVAEAEAILQRLGR